MPNFNGVWSLTTQLQYASAWPISPTIALFGGGDSDTSIIEKLLLTSTGTSTDFGTLSVGRERLAGVGNTTRAVFAGGEESSNVVTVSGKKSKKDLARLKMIFSSAKNPSLFL